MTQSHKDLFLEMHRKLHLWAYGGQGFSMKTRVACSSWPGGTSVNVRAPLKALLPLPLLAKLVRSGHERSWRQYGWEFRGYQEELEGFGEFQDCGGPAVLRSEKWMHCQPCDLGRSSAYLSKWRSFCTWEES